jgi:hypothetical protein
MQYYRILGVQDFECLYCGVLPNKDAAECLRCHEIIRRVIADSQAEFFEHRDVAFIVTAEGRLELSEIGEILLVFLFS